MSKSAFFWFRRDLRCTDNAGLYQALCDNESVRPVFIFDEDLLGKLSLKTDRRVLFIHETLQALKTELRGLGSDLEVYYGSPEKVWRRLLAQAPGSCIYANRDYEPRARRRDDNVAAIARKLNVEMRTFKDQVIFEEDEVLSGAQTPYTVFTPYKKKWLAQLTPAELKPFPVHKHLDRLHTYARSPKFLKLAEIGFEMARSENLAPFPAGEVSLPKIRAYGDERDFPGLDATTRIGVHLRFGTLSIRAVVADAVASGAMVWLSELIWREFFMQILYHHPRVVKESYRTEYDGIAWRKSKGDLQRWREGRTGYPFVDAGMRELNQTGFMHNRARMIVASFLTKHLLIDWREGEKYFAEKLLDYDLAANNGNWQWAAGCGCDAAPYFRIFNPETQRRRFDKDEEYVRKWIPELGTPEYPEPMIDHGFARDRALRAFYVGLKKSAT
jgi:deoxyribodipyrimidine photo-lyase